MKPTILVLALFCCMAALAQDDDRPVDIQANTLADGMDGPYKINKLIGDVRIVYNEITLTCDSAYDYRGEKRIRAFSNVTINQGDTMRITGDSLFYSSKNKVARMFGNVSLKKPEMTLYTNRLTYHTDTKQGVFSNGGTLFKDSTMLSSKVGYYNDKTGMARFNRHVTITGPDYNLWADTLNYELKADKALFFGPTVIHSEENKIYCEGGFYDTKGRQGEFYKNTRMEEGSNQVMADTLLYNQETGRGQGIGNVFFRDTTEDITLFSGNTIYDMHTGDMLATDTPTILMKFDEDTLQIAADTLVSAGDSLRTLHAYHHVKVFKSSLQANCDSLIYSEPDSMIHLFHDPVMWVDSFQFTGDTIQLKLKDDKLDRLFIQKNAFLTSNEGMGIFNQVKGQTLTGTFENDSLRSMYFDGNAETIYYAQDDSGRYIGANSLTCGAITMLFDAGELSSIKFQSSPEGQMDPIQDVNIATMELDGFSWLGQSKPHERDDFNIWKATFLPVVKPAWSIESAPIPADPLED